MMDEIDVSDAGFKYSKHDKLVDSNGGRWAVDDVMFSAYSGDHFYYLSRVDGKGQKTKDGDAIDAEMDKLA